MFCVASIAYGLSYGPNWNQRARQKEPFLANVRYMLSPVSLSSVTLVYSTQPVEIFGNFSMPFVTLAIH